MLSDYWSPLTPKLLLVVIIVFLGLDVIGHFINSKWVKAPESYRPVFWLFGFGLVVFVAFLLHFRWGLNQPIYGLGFGIAVMLLFPHYVSNGGPSGIVTYLKQQPVVLFLFLLLGPAVFVKSSLPPYLTDEVRYHLISPFTLSHSRTWSFGTNSELYTYMPKLIDTGYWLVFAATKSYAPGRLLHFLIYYSILAAAYPIIKRLFSVAGALIWLLLATLLMPDLLIIATSAYTDYSLAALLFLGILALLEALLNKKLDTVPAAIVLFALATGIKYTALATSAIFVLLAIIWATSDRALRQKLWQPLWLGKLLLLYLFFGGYWYLNNLIFTGNPVYPFFFNCKLSECISTSSFFDGWTLPVNWNNLGVIFRQITVKPVVSVMFLAGLVIASLSKKKGQTKSAILFLLAGMGLELFLLQFYSGFLQRYFLYLQLIALLICAAAVSLKSWYAKIALLASVGVAISTLVLHYHPWRNFSPQELAYARGKTNIYHWIKDRHPYNQDIIRFCADTGPQTIFVLDQKIWHTPTNEQFWHIFNINCQYGNLEAVSSVNDFFGKTAWFASGDSCNQEVLGTDGDTLANSILCRAQPSGKNLYRLDLTYDN